MSIKCERKQSPGMKMTALFVAFVFAVTSVSWNAPVAAAAGAAEAPVFSSLQKLVIPVEMGTITSELGASSGLRTQASDPRTVILIQDAHAVIDAQENIRKLLGYLGKEYGVGLAALEGAKGRIEPILFRTFPDPVVRLKVLSGYEKRGELSGPEIAAVLQETPGEFRGMEDWDLYGQNYAAYLRAQEKKTELLAQWSTVKKICDGERAKVYAPNLEEFQRLWEDFLADRISLLDLLLYLSEFKGLLNGSGRGDYTELPGLISSIGYEKTGRQESLAPMVRKIADEFKAKYLRGLGVKTEMNFYNKYQAFMTGQLPAGSMLQYLVQTGKECGKSVKLTTDLKKLLGHTEVLSEIKGSRLAEELRRFLLQVEASLITTPAQRELADKYQKLFLMKDLITLELNFDDLAAYEKEPAAYLSLFPEPTFETSLAPARAFYRAALERDQAFYKNIEAMLAKQTRDPKLTASPLPFNAVAVVAGGFHTNGLEKILKEKGVPYAVVTPKIDALDGQENYSRVMKGDVSFKEDLKTTYFDALMRHSAKLLSEALPLSDRVQTLKLWRDNLIRALAKEGRIAEAGKYLPYIDVELGQYAGATDKVGSEQMRAKILKAISTELDKFKKDSLARIWKTFELQLDAFTGGLNSLVTKKELNAGAVSTLLESVSQTKPSFLAAELAMDDTKSPPVWQRSEALPEVSSASRDEASNASTRGQGAVAEPRVTGLGQSLAVGRDPSRRNAAFWYFPGVVKDEIADIYQNIRDVSGPFLLADSPTTIQDKYNFTETAPPANSDLVLRYRNNGYLQREAFLDRDALEAWISKDRSVDINDVYDVLKDGLSNNETVSQPAIEKLRGYLGKLSYADAVNSGVVQYRTVKAAAGIPELIGIEYDGRTFGSLEDFRAYIGTVKSESLEKQKGFTGTGEVFYRAPRKEELAEILSGKGWLVTVGTNFEDRSQLVNVKKSQVRAYSLSRYEVQGYAGVTLEVVCPGPYFSGKSSQGLSFFSNPIEFFVASDKIRISTDQGATFQTVAEYNQRTTTGRSELRDIKAALPATVEAGDKVFQVSYFKEYWEGGHGIEIYDGKNRVGSLDLTVRGDTVEVSQGAGMSSGAIHVDRQYAQKFIGIDGALLLLALEAAQKAGFAKAVISNAANVEVARRYLKEGFDPGTQAYRISLVGSKLPHVQIGTNLAYAGTLGAVTPSGYAGTQIRKAMTGEKKDAVWAPVSDREMATDTSSGLLKLPNADGYVLDISPEASLPDVQSFLILFAYSLFGKMGVIVDDPEMLEHDTHPVRLLLENAYVHGNRVRNNHEIYVTAALEDNKLTMKVGDFALTAGIDEETALSLVDYGLAGQGMGSKLIRKYFGQPVQYGAVLDPSNKGLRIGTIASVTGTVGGADSELKIGKGQRPAVRSESRVVKPDMRNVSQMTAEERQKIVENEAEVFLDKMLPLEWPDLESRKKELAAILVAKTSFAPADTAARNKFEGERRGFFYAGLRSDWPSASTYGVVFPEASLDLDQCSFRGNLAHEWAHYLKIAIREQYKEDVFDDVIPEAVHLLRMHESDDELGMPPEINAVQERSVRLSLKTIGSIFRGMIVSGFWYEQRRQRNAAVARRAVGSVLSAKTPEEFEAALGKINDVFVPRADDYTGMDYLIHLKRVAERSVFAGLAVCAGIFFFDRLRWRLIFKGLTVPSLENYFRSRRLGVMAYEIYEGSPDYAYLPAEKQARAAIAWTFLRNVYWGKTVADSLKTAYTERNVNFPEGWEMGARSESRNPKDLWLLAGPKSLEDQKKAYAMQKGSEAYRRIEHFFFNDILGRLYATAGWGTVPAAVRNGWDLRFVKSSGTAFAISASGGMGHVYLFRNDLNSIEDFLDVLAHESGHVFHSAAGFNSGNMHVGVMEAYGVMADLQMKHLRGRLGPTDRQDLEVDAEIGKLFMEFLQTSDKWSYENIPVRRQVLLPNDKESALWEDFAGDFNDYIVSKQGRQNADVVRRRLYRASYDMDYRMGHFVGSALAYRFVRLNAKTGVDDPSNGIQAAWRYMGELLKNPEGVVFTNPASFLESALNKDKAAVQGAFKKTLPQLVTAFIKRRHQSPVPTPGWIREDEQKALKGILKDLSAIAVADLFESFEQEGNQADARKAGQLAVEKAAAVKEPQSPDGFLRDLGFFQDGKTMLAEQAGEFTLYSLSGEVISALLRKSHRPYLLKRKLICAVYADELNRVVNNAVDVLSPSARSEARMGGFLGLDQPAIRALALMGLLAVVPAVVEAASKWSADSIPREQIVEVQKALRVEQAGVIGPKTLKALRTAGGLKKRGPFSPEDRAVFDRVYRDAQAKGAVKPGESAKAAPAVSGASALDQLGKFLASISSPRTPKVEMAEVGVPAVISPVEPTPDETLIAPDNSVLRMNELVDALRYMNIATKEVRTNERIRSIRVKMLQKAIGMPENLQTGNFGDKTRKKFAEHKAIDLASKAVVGRSTSPQGFADSGVSAREATVAPVVVSVAKIGFTPVTADNPEIVKLKIKPENVRYFEKIYNAYTKYGFKLWPGQEKNIVAYGIAVFQLKEHEPTAEEKAEYAQRQKDIARDAARRNVGQFRQNVALLEGGGNLASNQKGGDAASSEMLEPRSALYALLYAANSTDPVVRSVLYDGLTNEQRAFVDSVLEMRKNKIDPNNPETRGDLWVLLQNSDFQDRMITLYLFQRLMRDDLLLPQADNLIQQAGTYHKAWAPGIFEYSRTLATFFYSTKLYNVLEELSRQNSITEREREEFREANTFSKSVQEVAIDMRKAYLDARAKRMGEAKGHLSDAERKYGKLVRESKKYNSPDERLILQAQGVELKARRELFDRGQLPQTDKVLPTQEDLRAMDGEKPASVLAANVRSEMRVDEDLTQLIADWNWEEVRLDEIDPAFNAWVRSGQMHPDDLILLKKILFGDAKILEELLKNSTGKVSISALDASNPDDDGRTVYLELKNPFPSSQGDLSILRIKGARPRSLGTGSELASHAGSGFAKISFEVNEAGNVYQRALPKKEILEAPGAETTSRFEYEVETLTPQGAALKEDADLEYQQMIAGTAGLGFETDYPLAKGVWKNKTHGGRATGLVIAGMRERDKRISVERWRPSLNPEGNRGLRPGSLLMDLVSGDLSGGNLSLVERVFEGIGRSLRAYHDAGYFHRFPHLGNWGVEVSKAHGLRIIMRDLDGTVTRASFRGEKTQRMEAAYRFLDLQYIVGKMTDLGFAFGTVNGDAQERVGAYLVPAMRSLIKGYFPEMISGEAFDRLFHEVKGQGFCYPTMQNEMDLERQMPFKSIWTRLYDLSAARTVEVKPEEASGRSEMREAVKVTPFADKLNFDAEDYSGFVEKLAPDRKELKKFQREFLTELLDAVVDYYKSDAWREYREKGKHPPRAFFESEEEWRDLAGTLAKRGFYEKSPKFFDLVIRHFPSRLTQNGVSVGPWETIKWDKKARPGSVQYEVQQKAISLMQTTIAAVVEEADNGKVRAEGMPRHWAKRLLLRFQNSFAGVALSYAIGRTLVPFALGGVILLLGISLNSWIAAIVTILFSRFITKSAVDKLNQFDKQWERHSYQKDVAMRALGVTPEMADEYQTKLKDSFRDIGTKFSGRSAKKILKQLQEIVRRSMDLDPERLILALQQGVEVAQSGDLNAVVVTLLAEVASHNREYFKGLEGLRGIDAGILAAMPLAEMQTSREVLRDIAGEEVDKVIAGKQVEGAVRKVMIDQMCEKLLGEMRQYYDAKFAEKLFRNLAATDFQGGPEARRALILSYSSSLFVRLTRIASYKGVGKAVAQDYAERIATKAKHWLAALELVKQNPSYYGFDEKREPLYDNTVSTLSAALDSVRLQGASEPALQIRSEMRGETEDDLSALMKDVGGESEWISDAGHNKGRIYPRNGAVIEASPTDIYHLLPQTVKGKTELLFQRFEKDPAVKAGGIHSARKDQVTFGRARVFNGRTDGGMVWRHFVVGYGQDERGLYLDIDDVSYISLSREPELAQASDSYKALRKPGITVNWDPLPGTGLEPISAKVNPASNEELEDDDNTPATLDTVVDAKTVDPNTMGGAFNPVEGSVDRGMFQDIISIDPAAFSVVDRKVYRNPGYQNPVVADGRAKNGSTPTALDEVERRLGTVVADSQAYSDLLSQAGHEWMLGDEFVSDCITHKIHALKEPNYKYYKMPLEKFIRIYLDAMMEYSKIAPEDHDKRLNMETELAKDFVYFARLQKIREHPQGKTAVLYDAGLNVPSVVYNPDADPRTCDPEVMTVLGIYQTGKGRKVVIDGQTTFLDPENILFAQWKGRTFIFYGSRTHTTVGGATVCQWRHAEAYWVRENGAGWLVKDVPENSDDLPPRLGAEIDRRLAEQGKSARVKDRDAFMKKVEDLGLLNFGRVYSTEWSSIENIFLGVDSKKPGLLSYFKKENPQIVNARAYMKDRKVPGVPEGGVATRYVFSPAQYQDPIIIGRSDKSPVNLLELANDSSGRLTQEDISKKLAEAGISRDHFEIVKKGPDWWLEPKSKITRQWDDGTVSEVSGSVMITATGDHVEKYNLGHRTWKNLRGTNQVFQIEVRVLYRHLLEVTVVIKEVQGFTARSEARRVVPATKDEARSEALQKAVDSYRRTIIEIQRTPDYASKIVEDEVYRKASEKKMVPAYVALVAALFRSGVLGQAAAKILYPFMGADLAFALQGMVRYLDLDPQDVDLGLGAFERTLGDKEAGSKALANLMGGRSVKLDATDLKNYEFLRESGREPYVLVLKGFSFYGGKAADRQRTLRTILGYLKPGDRVLVLSKTDADLLKQINVPVANALELYPEGSIATFEVALHKNKAFFMPNLLAVLQPTEDGSLASVPLEISAEPIKVVAPPVPEVIKTETATEPKNGAEMPLVGAPLKKVMAETGMTSEAVVASINGLGVYALGRALRKSGETALMLAEARYIDASLALEMKLKEKYSTEIALRDALDDGSYEALMNDYMKEFATSDQIHAAVVRITGFVATLGAVLDPRGLILTNTDFRVINAKTRQVEDLMKALPAVAGESALTVATDFPDTQAGIIFKMLEQVNPQRLIVMHRGDQKLGHGVGAMTPYVYSLTDPKRSLAQMVKRAVKFARGQRENLVAYWDKDFKLGDVSFFSVIAEIGRLADEDMQELACTAVRYIYLKYASLDQKGQEELQSHPEWILADLNKLGFASVIQMHGNTLVFDVQALADLFTAKQSIDQAA